MGNNGNSVLNLVIIHLIQFTEAIEFSQKAGKPRTVWRHSSGFSPLWDALCIFLLCCCLLGTKTSRIDVSPPKKVICLCKEFWIFFLFRVFLDRVLYSPGWLCNPNVWGWPWTLGPPVSTSWVLGLQVYTSPAPWSDLYSILWYTLKLELYFSEIWGNSLE